MEEAAQSPIAMGHLRGVGRGAALATNGQRFGQRACHTCIVCVWQVRVRKSREQEEEGEDTCIGGYINININVHVNGGYMHRRIHVYEDTCIGGYMHRRMHVSEEWGEEVRGRAW